MLAVILRLIACIGYLIIIPLILIKPLPVLNKAAMYGVCAFMGLFQGYECYRHWKRRKTTAITTWDDF